ncbi:MAG: NADH:ubiquinone oxidoreductase, membrane subunit N [Candidatus Nitrospira kreftii]|uniref:NADH-quinone oxidoreductase subunit N n=1 Tax=Candidatus Nitrospira kreftii TaxID=2652173 RepID=A0A7S8IZP5_9BACT|nr:MAG: NADH:ubiquinone oxidoreductase, membrane subunit N [Candidatus Nitrospira kreftii]
MIMTLDNFIALLPALILAAGALGIMLLAAWNRPHGMVSRTAAIVQASAFAGVPLASAVVPRQATALLLVDEFALFYIALILLGGIAVTVLSHGYLDAKLDRCNEYYSLLLLASLGGVVLAMSVHAASFFLGLELLSVSLYTLLSYDRENPRALEAGVKYLLLSAVASAFLLLGLALLYFLTGELTFSALRQALADDGPSRTVGLAGLALILTGIGFKLAVVPFHMWAPDVYQGSPTPVTAFVATLSKIAVVALLLRALFHMGALNDTAVTAALSVLAVASMFAGNLLALLQDNVKRLLAYSSIAHLGYLLVAVIAGGALGAEAVGFYVAAYMVTMLGIFGVLILLSRPYVETERMEDLRGLMWRDPPAGAIWVIAVLSLAGVPLTAGFVIKFYVVVAGLSSDRWLLVLFFVLNSVIGLFYYLKLIRVALARESESSARQRQAVVPRWTWSNGLVMATLILAIVWLGVYPIPFINWIEQTTTVLVAAD